MRQAPQPRRIDARIRGAMLMPLCALAVHQLRYYLAFGADANARLLHDGHAYLSTVEPLALFTAAAGTGVLLGRLARQTSSGAASRPRLRGWARSAAALVAIYCCQELLEGAFAPGHAAGLAGVVGHGGWIAFPAALLIAAALSLTLGAAERLIERFSRVRARTHEHAAGAVSVRPRARGGGADWRLVPLAGAIAGRAPPRASWAS